MPNDDDVAQLLAAAEKVLRYPTVRIQPHRDGCGGFAGVGDTCWCGMTDLRLAVNRFRSEDPATAADESGAARRRAERRARWWGQ